MSKMTEARSRAFYVVANYIRKNPDGKFTDHDLSILQNHPIVRGYLQYCPDSLAAIEALIEPALLSVATHDEHVFDCYNNTDVSDLTNDNDRQLLRAVYQLALRQGPNVLASNRYLALICPMSYRTIGRRAKVLSEMKFFTLYVGSPSPPGLLREEPDANKYEIDVSAPRKGSGRIVPEFPRPLQYLTPQQRVKLDAYEVSAKRPKLRNKKR